jgi:hypothetical protein
MRKSAEDKGTGSHPCLDTLPINQSPLQGHRLATSKNLRLEKLLENDESLLKRTGTQSVYGRKRVFLSWVRPATYISVVMLNANAVEFFLLYPFL